MVPQSLLVTHAHLSRVPAPPSVIGMCRRMTSCSAPRAKLAHLRSLHHLHAIARQTKRPTCRCAWRSRVRLAAQQMAESARRTQCCLRWWKRRACQHADAARCASLADHARSAMSVQVECRVRVGLATAPAPGAGHGVPGGPGGGRPPAPPAAQRQGLLTPCMLPA